MANTSRPVGIDLFAGAGGFSLGFEQAGFDIAAAVEIDPVHVPFTNSTFHRPLCSRIPSKGSAPVPFARQLA